METTTAILSAIHPSGTAVYGLATAEDRSQHNEFWQLLPVIGDENE